nr:immunoglobulin light chain junction region [Macaca mulatta]
CQHYYSIPNSF